MPEPGNRSNASAIQAYRCKGDKSGTTDRVSEVRANVPLNVTVPPPNCEPMSCVTRSLAVAVVASTLAVGVDSSARASRW